MRSKPDERKLFNVPGLVGKGTISGRTVVHGSAADVGGFMESVDAVAKSTNESAIGFSASIMIPIRAAIHNA